MPFVSIRISGTDLANPDFLRWCEAFRVPVR